MGKWLYLAKVIGSARDITTLVGVFSFGAIFVLIWAYFELSGDVQKKVLGYIKKSIVLTFAMAILTGLIPTKEETIQIMLLEQVNTENYNLMTEELDKGVDKILEVLNKMDKEKE